MLSRYITYFPLNDVTYMFREGGKRARNYNSYYNDGYNCNCNCYKKSIYIISIFQMISLI